MSHSLTLRVQNAHDAIPPACREADAWLRSHDAPSVARNLAFLAIEELVSNAIKHAYDDTLEHVLEFTLTLTDRSLNILVIDDGREFDASRAPQPDLTRSIDQRPIGGLGLHLLRELSDTMHYERRGDSNRLTLVKRLQ